MSTAAAQTQTETPAPEQKRRRHRLPFWAEVPLLLVAVAVLVVVVQGLLAQMYVVPSGSMETTLHGCPGCTDDRIAVDKISYRFTTPSPGDVVVFRGTGAWASNEEVSGGGPSDVLTELSSWASLSTPGEKDFVKRVIAVEGQTVACCDAGRVTIDGRPLDEPYLHIAPGGPAQQAPFAPVRLGPGQFWALGDNRNNSADSRAHGPVAVDDVIGRARAIVYPFPRFGGIGR